MNRVDLKQLTVGAEQLERQVRRLEGLCEEILRTEEKIKHMSYMDKTRRLLMRSREELEEYCRVQSLMAKVLLEACDSYIRTEERIVDRYNLDTVVCPPTRFDTSRITGMEEYQSLMPF